MRISSDQNLWFALHSQTFSESGSHPMGDFCSYFQTSTEHTRARMKSNNKCNAHYRLKKKKRVNQISNGHTQNDLKHHHHSSPSSFHLLFACFFRHNMHRWWLAVAVVVVVAVAVAVAGDPGRTLALRVHGLYLRPTLLLSYPHSKG